MDLKFYLMSHKNGNFFCNNLDLQHGDHLDKRVVVLGGVHDHDFLSVF